MAAVSHPIGEGAGQREAGLGRGSDLCDDSGCLGRLGRVGDTVLFSQLRLASRGSPLRHGARSVELAVVGSGSTIRGLLSGPEVPGLITRHGDIAPDRDHSVRMYGELNLVALADVQCLPDRTRQGELRLLAKPRSSVGLRL